MNQIISLDLTHSLMAGAISNESLMSHGRNRQKDRGLILDHDLGYITETLRMGFPIWKMGTTGPTSQDYCLD